MARVIGKDCALQRFLSTRPLSPRRDREHVLKRSARPRPNPFAVRDKKAVCATRGARRLHGFTLIEVLIALSLLSLLMLVLTGAMRSMGQTEERVDARIQAADDYRAAVDLLQRVLGRVSARRFRSVNADGPSEMPFFEAGPNSLAWIGVMPARFGTGGRHYLRLAVEPGADGSGQLVLRYAPWSGEPGFANWGQAGVQVLAAPVSALALHYKEPASGQWTPVWPPPGLPFNELPQTLLPSAVALQIDSPGFIWPPLIAAVAPTRLSDPSSNIGRYGSFGGGGNRGGGGGEK
ncbi:MAG: prepilin-type N-terminal cleavage/methylation domain-containing protein [Burkholderiaceae bacterium]|jgi:general secretion pathway protein J|nr:prepilin-type N-terminal cleavage/methylation domain-containing protein [Burkholderiaceae bacterium]